jgi:hypothetical protein
MRFDPEWPELPPIPGNLCLMESAAGTQSISDSGVTRGMMNCGRGEGIFKNFDFIGDRQFRNEKWGSYEMLW